MFLCTVSEIKLVCHLKNYLQGSFCEYPVVCTWVPDFVLLLSPSHLQSILYLWARVEWHYYAAMCVMLVCYSESEE